MPERRWPGRVIMVRHGEADYEALHRHGSVYRGAQHAMESTLVIVSHEAVIRAATGAETVPVASLHPLLIEDG